MTPEEKELYQEYLDTLRATDGDGDVLTFGLVTPWVMRLTDSILTWTPSMDDTGRVAASAIVTDGRGGADMITWSITVVFSTQGFLPMDDIPQHVTDPRLP